MMGKFQTRNCLVRQSTMPISNTHNKTIFRIKRRRCKFCTKQTIFVLLLANNGNAILNFEHRCAGCEQDKGGCFENHFSPEPYTLAVGAWRWVWSYRESSVDGEKGMKNTIQNQWNIIMEISILIEVELSSAEGNGWSQWNFPGQIKLLWQLVPVNGCLRDHSSITPRWPRSIHRMGKTFQFNSKRARIH